LVVAGFCVNIDGVLVQRDDGCVSDEDVSKAFETTVEVGSSGIEIIDRLAEVFDRHIVEGNHIGTTGSNLKKI